MAWRCTASHPIGAVVLELAYGVPDEIAAEGFRAILRKVRPRIVHLHARTSAISELLVDAAHDSGAAVVFTYHTPTVSCARGTMMLFGQQPCDGFIEPKRCTACALSALGVPKSLAGLAALAPNILAAASRRLWAIPNCYHFCRFRLSSRASVDAFAISSARSTMLLQFATG